MRMIVRTDADRNRFIGFIKQIKLEKPFTAIFERLVEKRSNNQNNTFHMWMSYLEKATGQNRDVWKEMYKREY